MFGRKAVVVDVVITDCACFEVLKLSGICQVSGLAVSQVGIGFGH